jgi:cytoskeletal protein RodZ
VGASRRPDDVDGFPTRDFSVDAAESSSPWYLKRWVLALWGLAVVILIAAIIYGLAILARGNGGGAPAPTTTHPSTTTSSQTTSTSPTTTTPPATTTPSTETTIEPAPEPTSTPWTPQHPHRHWLRSNLPPLPPIPHF